MKGLSLALIVLSSIFFTACNPEELEQEQNPQTCGKSGQCQNLMDWDLILGKEERPYRIKLLINDKELINDCQSGFRLSNLTRGASVSTMVIKDFEPLTLKDSFKLTIYDLGSCYESKLYHEKENQPFEIRKVDEKERIWIEIL
jgi:hypothetical protein